MLLASNWFSIMSTFELSKKILNIPIADIVLWILFFNVNLNISLSVWHIFINDSENGLRGLTRRCDLQEGMCVVTFLFTSGTVVKVLADSTFVPIANNRMGSTAITFHIGVDDLALRHLRLMKLCEDLGALLFELLFNHILHSLVRWAFLSSTLLFSFGLGRSLLIA